MKADCFEKWGNMLSAIRERTGKEEESVELFGLQLELAEQIIIILIKIIIDFFYY